MSDQQASNQNPLNPPPQGDSSALVDRNQTHFSSDSEHGETNQTQEHESGRRGRATGRRGRQKKQDQDRASENQGEKSAAEDQEKKSDSEVHRQPEKNSQEEKGNQSSDWQKNEEDQPKADGEQKNFDQEAETPKSGEDSDWEKEDKQKDSPRAGRRNTVKEEVVEEIQPDAPVDESWVIGDEEKKEEQRRTGGRNRGRDRYDSQEEAKTDEGPKHRGNRNGRRHQDDNDQIQPYSRGFGGQRENRTERNNRGNRGNRDYGNQDGQNRRGDRDNFDRGQNGRRGRGGFNNRGRGGGGRFDRRQNDRYDRNNRDFEANGRNHPERNRNENESTVPPTVEKHLQIEPYGIKCWPQLSLYFLKVKVALTLRKFEDHEGLILIYPFKTSRFELYPSGLPNRAGPDFREKIDSKIQQKYFQKSPYLAKCSQSIGRFSVLIFHKVQEASKAEQSWKRSLITAFSLSQQKQFEDKKISFVLPVCKEACEFSLLVNLIEKCLPKIKSKGEGENIKSIYFTTNDPKYFGECSQAFMEKISSSIEDNEILLN